MNNKTTSHTIITQSESTQSTATLLYRFASGTRWVNVILLLLGLALMAIIRILTGSQGLAYAAAHWSEKGAFISGLPGGVLAMVVSIPPVVHYMLLMRDPASPLSRWFSIVCWSLVGVGILASFAGGYIDVATDFRFNIFAVAFGLFCACVAGVCDLIFAAFIQLTKEHVVDKTPVAPVVDEVEQDLDHDGFTKLLTAIDLPKD